MKIGILTLTPINNYGAIMQAFALQTVLKGFGHEVYILISEDERRKVCAFGFKPSPLVYPFVILKRLYRIYIKGERHLKVSITKQLKNEKKVVFEHILKFINDNIQVYNCQNYACIPENEFDAMVVGSDQIWNPKHCKDIKKSFLSFAESWKIKRVSYSASFGRVNLNRYSETDVKICRELLQKFDAVSVREDSAVVLCDKYFGVNALHLLDPAFLLDVEFYNKLIVDEKQQKCGIFSYLLYENTDNQIVLEMVSKWLKINSTKTILPKVYVAESKNLIDYVYPSPLKWLAAFRDAEFVVTDSFHGVVFSIIFNKPFVVKINSGADDARFSSILRMFGLEDRLISSSGELTEAHLLPIDYDRVNKVKKEWQIKSFQFLKNNLK